MAEPTNPTIRHALGTFEMLRRLRFLADDIHFVVQTDEASGRTVFATVLYQEGHQGIGFACGDVAPDPESRDRIADEMREGGQWWNSRVTPEDRKRLLDEWHAHTDAALFLLRLMNHGVYDPRNFQADPLHTSTGETLH